MLTQCQTTAIKCGEEHGAILNDAIEYASYGDPTRSCKMLQVHLDPTGNCRMPQVQLDPTGSCYAPQVQVGRYAEVEPMPAGWQGFSMEEARRKADAGQKAAMAKTPQEVFTELQRGNMRFWTGRSRRPERSAFERRALISKQFPSVAILGCSDSRVPIEIVFDAALGDIFVIRVAGNCLDTGSMASLQYAIHHLNVKVLMVLGHEGCGAVKAAGLHVDAIKQEPDALGDLLNKLKDGLDHDRFQAIQDTRSYDREAVVTNVHKQMRTLSEDKGIMEKVEAGELFCVGGFYEISSGIVDYFAEVTATHKPKMVLAMSGFDTADTSPGSRARAPKVAVTAPGPGVTPGVASSLQVPAKKPKEERKIIEEEKPITFASLVAEVSKRVNEEAVSMTATATAMVAEMSKTFGAPKAQPL
eukprot:TRINITY_DN303_c0_g4_i1.p1 TRINITY_DN303_c0_g4~~TRINITY_DN303_c0_g4_i1.p1  ORF type:complete len:415 (-),score=103.72 TRINITY_DN303_c0_g4_i1:665-1909(-)